MSLIKSPSDIASLKKGGLILGKVLLHAAEIVKPGLSMIELNDSLHAKILELGATPSFLGYDGFPAATCLSVNDELVHGIPRDLQLKEGDIIGVDVGLWFEKRCVDAAVTLPVGKVSPEARRLLEVTENALLAAIKAIKPFQRIGMISATVQKYGDEANLGIVRTLTGHGVGHAVHEEPSIPNYGRSSDGMLIKPGMVLAIEPMFTLGGPGVVTDSDGWTIRTADGSLSAQFEHTILITNKGAEVLTKPLQRLK